MEKWRGNLAVYWVVEWIGKCKSRKGHRKLEGRMVGLFQFKSIVIITGVETQILLPECTYVKLNVAKRLPLLQKRSNDSSNGRACRKSHDADERAILVHVPEDILNRFVKASDTIFVNITVSPCPHGVAFFLGLIWVGRQLP